VEVFVSSQHCYSFRSATALATLVGHPLIMLYSYCVSMYVCITVIPMLDHFELYSGIGAERELIWLTCHLLDC